MRSPGTVRARVLTAMVAAVTVSGLVTAPALADTAEGDSAEIPPPPGSPTQQQVTDAVRVFEPDWNSFEPAVVELGRTERDGEEVTVVLQTDILFAPGSWGLPANASDTIADLVADIPDGAEVGVAGHTDSIVGAVDNTELSQNRAEAVAAVIEQVRPDLVLAVAGYAATEPAVTENPEDPSTYAANRRVEIDYDS